MQEESFGIIPLKKKDSFWHVYLVRLKSGNHIGFPKGHKNRNETDIQAASRELKEETNLSVKKFLSDKPLIEEYQLQKDKNIIHKIVYYYIAQVEGDFKIDTNEVIEGFFVDLKKAKDLLTYDNSKKTVLEVIEFLNKNFI